ncbi:MAG: M23 family metallopeptidase [Rickettsiales bacterium]
MQFTVGVPIQLCVMALFLSGVLWSSYATGRFLAAKSLLDEQSNTIRLVTNKKVDNMLNVLLPTSYLLQNPTKESSATKNFVSIGGNQKRVDLLEKQVADLKIINEAIIGRVRKKTNGQIKKLESIVQRTGLDISSIKEQAEKSQITDEKNAEGGPYIPDNMPKISEDTSEIFDSLDTLQALRQAVDNLPLSTPIKNGIERSHFGYRVDPFNGNIASHSGIDLAAPSGSFVYSTASGTVKKAKRNGSYGNMVDIDHGFGIVTRYGHLSKINVKKGDKVKKNEIIGVQGSTGRSTGDHLHYEVRFNGKAINPRKFLQTGKLLELENVISQN